MSSGGCQNHIDVGLAVLSAVNRNGVALSAGAIAEVCGCSKRWIQMVERVALNKLRCRMALDREKYLP